MVWLLFLILWPVAEVLAAIAVASAIGVLATVLLLLAGIPLGSALLRAEGRVALRRWSAAVNAGRPPAREVLDGALVLAGSSLLIVPGFITDALGLLLLLPPGRAVARRLIARNVRHRLVVRLAGFGGRSREYDVEGTATDADPSSLDPRPPRLPAA